MKHASSLCALLLTVALFGSGLAPVQAQPPVHVPVFAPAQVQPLPSLRDQATEQQAWLQARLDRVLPALMREYGVQMWILSMREYGEDPVFWSITAPTTFAARRRSIYIFTLQPDGTLERLALGGTSQGGVFEAYRSARPAPTQPTAELVGDEQWTLLRELIEDRDPANIALNIDSEWAFADGLHAGEREALEAALGPYVQRVMREPRLAVDYIALRLPKMMPRYRKIMETVHAMISEAFSNAVITPGVTTTDDIAWWLRQRAQELGYRAWFHPSVDVSRQGAGRISGNTVIEHGDLLWTDFGVVAMNLHTDTQHLGYVLKPGETEPPAGLQRCLADSNRMQDLLLEEMVPGRTGNEILAATLAHPIGDHGHGAGPLIGRWDAQDGVPVRGDALLLPSTWHSIELQATRAIPEWGGEPANCRQEEEAYLDEQGARHWVYRRQSAFHLVW